MHCGLGAETYQVEQDVTVEVVIGLVTVHGQLVIVKVVAY